MNCPECNKPMIRVKHTETQTEVIEVYACINLRCGKFSGTDLNNPKHTQEVRRDK